MSKDEELIEQHFFPIMVAFPDDEMVTVMWTTLLPVSRAWEGFHYGGGDHVIEHACWTISEQSPMPIYTLHLVDEDDLPDEDDVPTHTRRKPSTQPDIKIGGM